MTDREQDMRAGGGQRDEPREVEGFALLERETVRRLIPGFDSRRCATPSPRHRLPMPLAEATIGLVSTSGARLAGQPRFSRSQWGDPSYRVIPADTPIADVRFNHVGYDVRTAEADPDCVFPLPLLRRYAAEGRIGSVVALAYGLMGYIAQTDVLLGETAPAIASALAAEGVDLVFLVPA